MMLSISKSKLSLSASPYRIILFILSAVRLRVIFDLEMEKVEFCKVQL